MSHVTVTCGGCGHVANWIAFDSGENGRALPANEWRCPKCGIHIRVAIELPSLRRRIVPAGRLR